VARATTTCISSPITRRWPDKSGLLSAATKTLSVTSMIVKAMH